MKAMQGTPSVPPGRSKAAVAYATARREKLGWFVRALWIDVEAAYDAGMRHAIERRGNARRQMAEAGARIMTPDCGAHAERDPQPTADPPPTHICSCCGEPCTSSTDCCSDEFPEPGQIRETGR